MADFLPCDVLTRAGVIGKEFETVDPSLATGAVG